jgi:hypothetical protein
MLLIEAFIEGLQFLLKKIADLEKLIRCPDQLEYVERHLRITFA